MPSFEIKYMKKLCDDSGHEHDACQNIVTLQAPNAHEALRLAEAQVCSHRHLANWTIFADAVELRMVSAMTEPR
jgi:RecA/RadA recombinase